MTSSETLDRLYIIEKKTWYLLLLGITLYDVSNIFVNLYSPGLFRFFQVIGIMLIITFGLRVVVHKNNIFKSSKTYWFFLALGVVAIVRFESFSSDELRLALFQPIHFLAYVVPLLGLVSFNLAFVKLYHSVAIWLCIGYIAVSAFIFFKMENSFTSIQDIVAVPFISSAGFLFLTWRYNNIKVRFLSLFILLLFVLIGALAGRRNIILTSSTYLVFGYLYILLSADQKGSKIINLFTSFTIILGFIYLNLNISLSNRFALLAERVDTDSRSEVLFFFLNDFATKDWLFGRGIDGKYYNPIKYWDIANEESRDVTYRETIENGYLFLVLKEGVFGALAFVTVALRSVYFGFFKTKNNLTRVFAIVVLSCLIDMLTFAQTTFSVKYVIVWISIAICYQPTLRSIDENIVKKFLSR